MTGIPERLEGVSVLTKANVYFGGRVVSHTVLLPDGRKKTIGLIHPGTYTFDTREPETLQVVAGSCRVRLAGEEDWTAYAAGQAFLVPGNLAFEIAVEEGIAEYLCSFG